MANAFKVIRSEYLFNKITSHLSPTDFPHCSLVNRYWNLLFRPLVWHTLAFSEDLHSEEPFHKNHRAILNQLGFFIRKLHSHDCRSLVFFNGPQSRCRDLVELEFTACLAHESTTHAVQLIRDNLQLERLTIQGDFTLTRNSEAPQNLFSALLQHPALTHLQLGNVDTTIDYLFVRALLAHLPLTLQSLVVSWTSITNLDLDQVNASDPSWPIAYPRLRYLAIDTKFMDQTHEYLLFPLLRRCPELMELSITHMDEWTTSSSSLPSRPSHSLAVLIRNHCPNVRRLSVNRCQESESLAVNLIGMESFQIELCFFRGTNVQSTDIQLLLTSCPLLTKFVIRPDKIRYDINGVLPQDCSGLKLTEMTRSNWVCLGLEQLGLRILDDRSVDESTTAKEQNQATVMMRRALAQIGDLALLQQLGLEWTPVTRTDPRTTQVPKDFVEMDFSLLCGLNLLSGLKQLRKLQVLVSGLAMGQAEMEWIVDNWPKLNVIAGLSRSLSSRSKSTTEKEPAHIGWLHEHRSSLSVL
ncbi:hypothetical protein EC957_001360 [Mortierella hygrophila]|uniref:F-box domain-containing protein n=1 Tax=Mortierella hygrophila TaxID=979708 RepID=A0A9P6F4V9_9FUNG|nr:hypothetical protein EC957_001360 [Mortierella hygrophila]